MSWLARLAEKRKQAVPARFKSPHFESAGPHDAIRALTHLKAWAIVHARRQIASSIATTVVLAAQYGTRVSLRATAQSQVIFVDAHHIRGHVKNSSNLLQRATARGTQLEHSHPLDRKIVRSPVRIDWHQAGVLDATLFAEQKKLLVRSGHTSLWIATYRRHAKSSHCRWAKESLFGKPVACITDTRAQRDCKTSLCINRLLLPVRA